MCLTASSPEWISRPIEGSAWLASKRRVFGLTTRMTASVKARATPALTRRWSRGFAACGQVLHKPR